MLCGAAPLPASSGRTHRHRLNRGGDRQANAALYRIVLCRLRWDHRTRAYAARRTAEGMSKPEIIRCLKRYIAREIYTALLNPRRLPPSWPSLPPRRRSQRGAPAAQRGRTTLTPTSGERRSQPEEGTSPGIPLDHLPSRGLTIHRSISAARCAVRVTAVGHPAPASYGDGLAVLVVGSADTPFRTPRPARGSRVSRCPSSSSTAAPPTFLTASTCCGSVRTSAGRRGQPRRRRAPAGRRPRRRRPGRPRLARRRAGRPARRRRPAPAGRDPRAPGARPRRRSGAVHPPLPRPARAVLRRTWPPRRSRRRGPRRLVVGTRCCCCGGRRWTPSTASTPATRAGSTTSTSPTASPAPAG